MATGQGTGLSPLPLNLDSKSITVQVHGAAFCSPLHLFYVRHFLPTEAKTEVQGVRHADSTLMSVHAHHLPAPNEFAKRQSKEAFPPILWLKVASRTNGSAGVGGGAVNLGLACIFLNVSKRRWNTVSHIFLTLFDTTCRRRSKISGINHEMK